MENQAQVENQQNQSNIGPNSRWSLKKSKRIVIAGITVLIFLIAITIALVFLFRQGGQATLPPPPPENLLLATVADQPIYRDDVVEIALEQILASGITNEVILQYLDITIERAILDYVAQQRQLQIPETANKLEYYENLKETVVQGSVSEITAYDISWWIPPPPEYEQRPEFTIQRADTVLAVPQIVAGLQSGQTPNQIVQQIIIDYPSLAPIIGINGGLYNLTGDKSLFDQAKLHYYDTQNSQIPFFNELYSMNEGEIEGFIWDNGSGAAVIHLTNLIRGEGLDYEQWLAEQYSQLVTLNQKNIDTLL